MLNSYTCYRTAQIISRSFPRRFAYWLGLRIADLFYAGDKFGRQSVISNFRQILAAQGLNASDEKLAKMARSNFRFFGKYMVDFFKFARFTPKDIQRLVNWEHFEYLEQAESLQKGLILVTAHLGNWELGGAIMAGMGRRMNVVFMPQRASKINELFQAHRIGRGMNCIPIGHAASGVIKALKRRECVAMLADRDFTAHNQQMLFFDKPARLSSGPARIAAMTGAPLLPGFLLRQPDETFLLRLYPPIIPGAEENAATIQAKLRDILEKEIANNPLQWFMFDDFWNPQRNRQAQ